MKRFGRILFNGLAAVSVLLLVTTLGLWVVSRHTTLTAMRGSTHGNMIVISGSHSLNGVVVARTSNGGKGESWVSDGVTPVTTRNHMELPPNSRRCGRLLHLSTTDVNHDFQVVRRARQIEDLLIGIDTQMKLAIEDFTAAELALHVAQAQVHLRERENVWRPPTRI